MLCICTYIYIYVCAFAGLCGGDNTLHKHGTLERLGLGTIALRDCSGESPGKKSWVGYTSVDALLAEVFGDLVLRQSQLVEAPNRLETEVPIRWSVFLPLWYNHNMRTTCGLSLL